MDKLFSEQHIFRSAAHSFYCMHVKFSHVSLLEVSIKIFKFGSFAYSIWPPSILSQSGCLKHLLCILSLMIFTYGHLWLKTTWWSSWSSTHLKGVFWPSASAKWSTTKIQEPPNDLSQENTIVRKMECNWPMVTKHWPLCLAAKSEMMWFDVKVGHCVQTLNTGWPRIWDHIYICCNWSFRKKGKTCCCSKRSDCLFIKSQ